MLGKSWTEISKLYNFNLKNISYGTYSYSDLVLICKMIIHSETTKTIVNRFPKYDSKKLKNIVKKMKQGKLYKDIFKEVKRSTTIVNEYGLVHIHKR